MYRKQNNLISSIEDPKNYISGYDIYDSMLLNILSDPTLPRESYEITTYEYRPDLIAQEFYGSTTYMGLLLLQTKITLPNFKRGVILSLLPKSSLDIIIKNI